MSADDSGGGDGDRGRSSHRMSADDSLEAMLALPPVQRLPLLEKQLAKGGGGKGGGDGGSRHLAYRILWTRVR